jgi:hypothetical protein
MTKYSDNSIEVWYKDGVPLSADNDNSVPKLVFKKDSEMLVADYSDNFTFETAADLIINEVPSNLHCSFAGGCLYTIVSEGLTRTLKDIKNSSIEVCGNTCSLDKEISNSGAAVCRLESLVSSYSVKNYELVQP